jgi:hypothetical protein
MPTYIQELLFGNCGCGSSICEPTKTIISATNIESDIIFDKRYPNSLIQINYFARNGYNFNLDLVDTTNGLPPEGGVWVDVLSGSYANAYEPWKNLLNSEFSVLVEEVNTDGLYGIRDIGLFVPSYLGLGRYELRKGTIEYTEYTETSAVKVFRDPKYFLDEYFTLNELDSSWMKIQTGHAKGKIQYVDNKRFDGYDSTLNLYSETSNQGKIYQTDIFGNRYMLQKGVGNSIYNNLSQKGELIVSDYANNLTSFEDFNPSLLEKLSTFGEYVTAVYTEYLSGVDTSAVEVTGYDVTFENIAKNYILNNEIYDINIFYDTICLELPTIYLMYKNQEDYITPERTVDYKDIKMIDIPTENAINHWFDDKKNIVWIVTITDTYPTIYRYSVNGGSLENVYDLDSVNWNFEHTIKGKPQISFNSDHTLRLSMITELSSQQLIFLTSNFVMGDDGLSCLEINALSGMELGNKQFLKQYPLDDKKQLLIFETQESPNKLHQIVYSD